MTVQPLDLTASCPGWCQDHHHDADASYVEHEAIVGVAGPFEVSLQCFVFAGRADPVTELVLYDTSPTTSGERTMIIPLDQALVGEVAAVLQRAVLLERPGER